MFEVADGARGEMLVPDGSAQHHALTLHDGEPLVDIVPKNFQNHTRGQSTIALHSAVSYSNLSDYSHILGVSEVIGTDLKDDSVITNCRVTHSKLSDGHILGESDVHQTDLINSTISGNSIVKYCKLKNAHVCCGADLSQCELVNARICGGRYKYCNFVDALVSHCDFVQVKVRHCAVSDQRNQYGSISDRVDDLTEGYFKDHTAVISQGGKRGARR